ncbi:MAG: hypothetical protein ACE5J5_02385 [Candidatus Hydrothermarchaeales archaeon]
MIIDKTRHIRHKYKEVIMVFRKENKKVEVKIVDILKNPEKFLDTDTEVIVTGKMHNTLKALVDDQGNKLSFEVPHELRRVYGDDYRVEGVIKKRTWGDFEEIYLDGRSAEKL